MIVRFQVLSIVVQRERQPTDQHWDQSLFSLWGYWCIFKTWFSEPVLHISYRDNVCACMCVHVYEREEIKYLQIKANL